MSDRGATLSAMREFDEAAERAWLRALPKTEIHVHLEGAIPLDALWRIAARTTCVWEFHHIEPRRPQTRRVT